MLLLRILGRIDAMVAGEPTSVGGRAHERLLAVLAASGAQGMRLEDIAYELWLGADAPADPIRTLRTYVSRVRSLLGSDALLISDGICRLNVPTDAEHFENLVDRARRQADTLTAGELWDEAVTAWRGSAFGGHDDLPSVQPVAERLRELRAESMEAWFGYRLAAGQERELAADLGAAVEEFPLREGFRLQQMTALANAGRQAEALREGQRFRADLTEIGLEPSVDFLELEQSVVAGDAIETKKNRHLRDYRVVDRLGEGAFSIVYRAEQASVGRDVAVKQIRAELANRPEFIRLFEAEAHLVARLEHPHIVPLYDFWREPGSAYLVMRYLRGGSLASQLLVEPLSLERTASIMMQIGDALDEAHSRGIIHRDIKPDNILLDGDGRAYLSDFGIAVGEAEAANPEVWLSNGSPAYASPEQLRREVVGPSSDVHGLGIAAFEALTGDLPFSDESSVASLLERQLNDPIPPVTDTRPNLPSSIDAVLQKATAKEATERYESAGAFARALAQAAGIVVDSVLTVEDRNPYKGLLAFGESDAPDFVGRERLTEQLLRSVAEHSVTTVVGPSGSGKSSVVRAGLIPALRQGRVPGSSSWWITTMSPGADPFANLEAALLRVASTPAADLADALRNDRRALTRALHDIVPEDRRLILVIDQLEELFTLSDVKTHADFLESVSHAISGAGDRLRIVQTLRADFYDQPLRYPEYALLIQPGTVPVHPLAPDELELVITAPARSVGTRFEPGLVALITADVADQPGALPLLQHTLSHLYELREANTITAAAYTSVGGVAGAVATRAEHLYAEGSDGEQAATRRVFSRLVAVGDGARGTRRTVRRDELGTSAAVTAVLDRFGKARLLAFDRDARTREPTVEVAHEAIINEWPRLRDWLDEDRDGLRVQRHLTDSASEWAGRGELPGDLYRGARLQAADEWAQDHGDDLNQLERAFLDAGLAAGEMEREAERRRLRRLRQLLSAVAIVAVGAVVAGALAFAQRGRANDQAALAQQNAAAAVRAAGEAEQNETEAEAARSEAEAARGEAEVARGEAEQNAASAEQAQGRAEELLSDAERSTLINRSLVEAPEDADVGLLLAREAAVRHYDRDAQGAILNALTYVPAVERVISEGRLPTGQQMGAIERCFHVTSSREFLIGASIPGDTTSELITIDPLSGDVSREKLLDGQRCLHYVSADGRHRVGPGESSTELTDRSTAEVVARFAPCPFNLGWAGDGRFVIFQPPLGQGSSDGTCDGPVQLVAVDPDTLAIEPLSEPSIIVGGNRSKFGRWANFGVLDPETGTVSNHRWDLESLTKVEETVLPPEIGPTGLNVSPQQNLFVITTADGLVALVRPGTGEPISMLEIPSTVQPAFFQASLNQSQELLAVATTDGYVRVFDVATGKEVAPPMLSPVAPVELIWLDDTKRLAALMADGEVRVFNIESGALAAQSVPTGSADADWTVRFDTKGTMAAVVPGFWGIGDGRVTFVDLASGERVDHTVDGASGAIPRADGSIFVFTDEVQGVILSSDGSREVIGGPPNLSNLNNSGYGDGRLAVTAGGPSAAVLTVFDLDRPEAWIEIPLSTLPGPLRSSVYPLSSGNVLMGRIDGSVIEITPSADIEKTWRIHDDRDIPFGLDVEGDLLLTNTTEGNIAVTNMVTDEVADDFATGRTVRAASFAPGGTVVTVDSDGLTRLWDIETRREIGVLHPGGDAQFGRPAINADGSGVWVAIGSSLVLLPTQPEVWFDLACERADRELDEQEWQELIPGDEPFRPICPDRSS